MKTLVLALAFLAAPLLAQHQIQLTANSPTCLNDSSCGYTTCTCGLEVWRASCPTASTCPVPGQTGWISLPNSGNLTGTVSTLGTAWVFNDTDTALVASSIWTYAMRSYWTADTTQQKGNFTAGTPALTIPASSSTTHSATLNYSNTGCTTSTPCNLQVYRAVCSSATSCPSFSTGGIGTTWTQLAAGTATSTSNASGTSWVVTDQDTALKDATTYVYVATNSFQSSSTVYSNASTPWSGTTNTITPQPPPPPQSGTGNTITKKKEQKHEQKKFPHMLSMYMLHK